jgi:hypothetical protein
MPVKLLRLILTLFIVTAYIGATVLQAAPTYAATAHLSSSSISGMAHDQAGKGDKMPCKGMSGMVHKQAGHDGNTPCNGVLPNCVTDIGCIYLLSMPTPDLTLFTTTGWSSVIYNNAPEALHGRTIKPALGPPISLA